MGGRRAVEGSREGLEAARAPYRALGKGAGGDAATLAQGGQDCEGGADGGEEDAGRREQSNHLHVSWTAPSTEYS